VNLGPVSRRAGFRLDTYDTVGSTNDVAAAAMQAGDPGRLWITAASQTSGRGRSGRAWASPPGNLACSLLLRESCPPALAPQLGFVAGIALHDAVAAATGLRAPRLALKWPNDLLLDAAKLAGILVEGLAPAPGRLAAVIGIGLNVAGHPHDTPYKSTDLAAGGHRVGAAEVFAHLTDAIVERLEQWDGGAGFPAIRREWLDRAGGLGQTITVRRAGGERRGVFVDLNADGRLLLGEGGQISAISAGDVFLEGAHVAVPAMTRELDTH
jgi:BirA family biotin operon repressor/biotin-[acetyl-CoA-carboxylase] ligase